ncbi:Uncharacterised protein [Mycobacteroides abscessus subsp. abscessus]|nr:Uncharacterised protein [Mycobacteroides abscessus subsp. abscessus]
MRPNVSGRGDDVVKPVHAGCEQLCARQVLHELDQHVTGQRILGRIRAAKYLVHAIADHRDGEHIGVHRGNGEDPDQPVLDGRPAAVVLPNHHNIRVDGVPQVGGCGGLREHQQLIVVGELWEHLFAALEQPQPARLIDGGVPVLDGAPLVSQQREVPVDQPAQQIRDFCQLGRGKPGVAGRGVQITGQFDHRVAHGVGVGGDVAAVFQRVRQLGLDECQSLGVDGRRQLQMNPALGIGRRVALRMVDRGRREQCPIGSALHGEDGVHQVDDGHALAPQ